MCIDRTIYSRSIVIYYKPRPMQLLAFILFKKKRWQCAMHRWNVWQYGRETPNWSMRTRCLYPRIFSVVLYLILGCTSVATPRKCLCLGRHSTSASSLLLVPQRQQLPRSACYLLRARTWMHLALLRLRRAESRAKSATRRPTVGEGSAG